MAVGREHPGAGQSYEPFIHLFPNIAVMKQPSLLAPDSQTSSHFPNRYVIFASLSFFPPQQKSEIAPLQSFYLFHLLKSESQVPSSQCHMNLFAIQS